MFAFSINKNMIRIDFRSSAHKQKLERKFIACIKLLIHNVQEIIIVSKSQSYALRTSKKSAINFLLNFLNHENY